MTSKTFDKAFYTVRLDYDETKPETEYEKELLKRYLHFLDKMQEKRGQMVVLTEQYNEESTLKDEIDEELKVLEERYNSVSKAAEQSKRTNEIDPFDFPKMRDYFFDTNSLFLNLHNDKINRLRDLIDANEKLFDDLYNWFEEENSTVVYDEFDEYASELYNNYDKYSLDLSRFDEDVEDMKAAWRNTDEEWNRFFEFREATVKSTSLVTERLNAMNKLAETLQKDIDEMDVAWKAFNN